MNVHRAAVLLIDPRFDFNVGNSLRACALLGATPLCWTGDRVPLPDEWHDGARMPREERMKCYRRVKLDKVASTKPLDIFMRVGFTPVCVEIGDSTENLIHFQHPQRAVYVFGPEDGGVPKGVRNHCHRFVRIPVAIPADDPDARTPYNLAAAVNLVLYDRLLKQPHGHSPTRSADTLREVAAG